MKLKKTTKLILVSIISIAVVIFVSVRLSTEGFQTIDPTNYPGGNFLGYRVKNSLQELSSFIIKSSNPSGVNIKDCTGNIVWSSGSPESTSMAMGLYMMTMSGYIPNGTNIVTMYQQTVPQAAGVGINIASFVFANYEYPSAMCGGAGGGGGSVDPGLASGVISTIQGVSSTVGGVTGQTAQTSSSVSGQLINSLNAVFTPQVSASIVKYLQAFFKTGDTLLQS
jgi:hypothetical protein